MNWERIRKEHEAVVEQVFEERAEQIESLSARIAEALKDGRKLMLCGNGGSAADAQHFAGEFVNRFLREREPYAALALTTDTSILTCISNDYAFEDVFLKQVQALGQPGDVLIAISTSGGAENCCRAVEEARRRGIYTAAWTGGDGGRLAKLADEALIVSSAGGTPRIQEGHGLFTHLICERVEELMCAR